MPELPEVETIVRDLRPHLQNQVIKTIDLPKPSVVKFPSEQNFIQKLSPRPIFSIERRGKFILLALDHNEYLVVHLGMTGTFTLNDNQQLILPHTHLRLHLKNGQELRYQDPRRFGRILLGTITELQENRVFPKLGLDPLTDDFVNKDFASQLHRLKRPIKAILLDQSIISGCGNIYADEACFLAGIRPDRKANKISPAKLIKLLHCLVEVINKALLLRGTSFSNYRDGFGAKGNAYEQLKVYGRTGLPCLQCGRLLLQTKISNRTTVYCSKCQF